MLYGTGGFRSLWHRLLARPVSESGRSVNRGVYAVYARAEGMAYGSGHLAGERRTADRSMSPAELSTQAPLDRYRADSSAVR